jgi:hypothetical protein
MSHTLDLWFVCASKSSACSPPNKVECKPEKTASKHRGKLKSLYDVSRQKEAQKKICGEKSLVLMNCG